MAACVGLENGSTWERYLQSGNRLLRAIEDKLETVESIDTVRDLQIMARHLQLLLRHVQKDLAEATTERPTTGAHMRNKFK